MEQAEYSERDTRGMLFVDCSECERVGNGGDNDKCSSGWEKKTGNHGGCFMGELIEGLEVK